MGRSKSKRAEVQAEVRAAGCVVWRRPDDHIEVVVVHRPRYDDWSFPKGKVDPGETEAETAVREVMEETALGGDLGPQLSTISYTDHKGRHKTVHYWLMACARGSFEANDEVDELRWLEPDEARSLLTYSHDQLVLDEAVATLRG